MNPDKIKLIAEKVMGWRELPSFSDFAERPENTFMMDSGDLWIVKYGMLDTWTPHTNPADTMELLEKLSDRFAIVIRKIGNRYEVTAKGFYAATDFPTLPAAIVAYACQLHGIPE